MAGLEGVKGIRVEDEVKEIGRSVDHEAMVRALAFTLMGKHWRVLNKEVPCSD